MLSATSSTVSSLVSKKGWSCKTLVHCTRTTLSSTTISSLSFFSTSASSSSSSGSSTTAMVADRWGALATPYETYAAQKSLSFPIVPKEDHGNYLEYSVIHTDRSLNLMSSPFQQVMRDLNSLLKTTYSADKVAIIPGSGTFGMESVARQYATDKHVMVLRNGWFSFRWTEIFDMGKIPSSHTVLKAQPVPISTSKSSSTSSTEQQQHQQQQHTHYAPYPVEQVVDAIYKERPAVFFCPHVETSTGMMISDIYIKTIADAIHSVGGIFVLDCIASGTVWVDMKQLGIDVVISAPQKGWTGTPCAALVMMSERAVDVMQSNTTVETSFSISLKRWSAIMDTYEKGGFGYHTTMPTDSLRDFHEISIETLGIGLPELKAAQNELGWKARAIVDSKGLISVAAPGFQAPGVLVYYSPVGTDNPIMMQRFKDVAGMQIAMGVPWRIDEPNGLKTFRIGLFGLDKLKNITHTLEVMEHGLDTVLSELRHTNSNDNAPNEAA